jgi:hypothetical protein
VADRTPKVHTCDCHFHHRSIAMNQPVRGAVLALLALTLTACASTVIRESWREPTAGRLEFRKVLALVISADGSIRRIAEDELVRQMQGTEAVAAYTLLTEEDYQDLEQAKAKVTAAGFDGAVTMRFVSAEKQVTGVPGTYAAPYTSFWGYYGYAWPVVYEPGYLRTDTIVRVETNVYSVTGEKLLWAGISETFNPSDAQTLVRDVAQAVAKELKKQGLVS